MENEEVLFTFPFPGAVRIGEVGNVTLITHSNGGRSLHLQTGEYHKQSVEIE